MIFYREFFARPPTNTRVFPISGMIFIGKWRYPPTFFRDCFPIFFGRHPLPTCMLAYLLSYLLPCFVSSLTYLFSSAVFSFCLYLICFVYCSAWLRIKLYTKIGLHPHRHHNPPTPTHHQHTNSKAAISQLLLSLQLSKLNTFNFSLVLVYSILYGGEGGRAHLDLEQRTAIFIDYFEL